MAYWRDNSPVHIALKSIFGAITGAPQQNTKFKESTEDEIRTFLQEMG